MVEGLDYLEDSEVGRDLPFVLYDLHNQSNYYVNIKAFQKIKLTLWTLEYAQ